MEDAPDPERLQQLLAAVLLVPTPDEPVEPGRWTVEPVEVLSVLMVEEADGLAMPGFTSLEALSRWRPDGGTCAERDATWLLGVASADPEGRVLIDPGSPDALVLEPGVVAALAAGQVPGQISGQGPGEGEVAASVLVATPSEPLEPAVQDAVAAALADEPLVASARLLIVDDGSGEQPLVVMVDLGDQDPAVVDGAMQRIVAAIAARTDQAAGLRFSVVSDPWRASYESGGIVLYERPAPTS